MLRGHLASFAETDLNLACVMYSNDLPAGFPGCLAEIRGDLIACALRVSHNVFINAVLLLRAGPALVCMIIPRPRIAGRRVCKPFQVKIICPPAAFS
jgi:hypothetical protein